jgi:predicted transposase/invertase (TIGR01784 family)
VILNRSGKRAIRLDAWAVDHNNRQYATEMQNVTTSDNMRKRSRYYQGLLDTPILKSGKNTKYKELPATLITFITQDDIFQRDLAKYTFTEQCEEITGLHLEDGTTKIFLNMTSKNGDPALVSMLQYMKKSNLNNPEIIVQDDRIKKIDEVVTEVKESEEWEGIRMSILSYGIEKGLEQGKMLGIRAMIQENLEDGTEESRILSKLVKHFSLTPEQAKAYFDQFKSE